MGDSELNAPLLPEIFGVSKGGNPSGKGDASPTQNGRAATSEAVRDGSSADDYKNLLSNKSKEGWKFQPHMLLSRRGFHDAKHHSEGHREYNRKQREAIAGFSEVDSMEAPGSTSEGQEEEAYEGFAITLSYLVNVLLFIIKVLAAVKSGSLSIVASALDSMLDLLAGSILWFTKWTMQHQNKYKYPIGTNHLQPVGIVVFAAIMATLGMQVLLTAVQELFEGDTGHKMSNAETTWLTVVMGTAIVSKICLYLYCCNFKSDIVQAYATDHRLDILTNSVGLAAALLSNQYYWWIDAVGAMVLALYTITNWGKSVIENAASLVGQAAPPELVAKVTYMAVNHHPKIRKLDTVRAFLLGGLYFVEVDIELPEDMSLREAHDIGESLQNKLEALTEVERAYVHLDYESTHRPEHTIHGYMV
ncbi:unnamed protein product [Sphagnum troendelagicum]|uniref:Cation efflux protein cytoplasmic domain-containing protein n=1 Tax=Sphagnum troendelagicum TaxID=128251 RepID=A0ABP0V5A7_9BRYO